MSAHEFQVPPLLNYVALIAWAMSGAIVGVRKGYDITGVFVVALVSSVGGGLLRDGLFLQQIPVAVTNYLYLPIILSVTLFMAFLWRYYARLPFATRTPQVISLIDSIGTPAFAIVGMQMSLQAGIALPGVILIGCINGVGGGILRDILVNEAAAILRPGQYYALVVFLVCVLFLGMTLGLGFDAERSAWALIALFFGIRLLIVRYNWRSQPILGLPEE